MVVTCSITLWRTIKPMANIYEGIPFDMPDEFIEKIAGSAEKGAVVERIISRGHASPPGFWYDQEKTEFIILLKGKAALLFKDQEQILEMLPGDYIEIPPHALHRVEWTAEEEDTVWLTFFY
jgi:cupin 2 domain-containing protein